MEDYPFEGYEQDSTYNINPIEDYSKYDYEIFRHALLYDPDAHMWYVMPNYHSVLTEYNLNPDVLNESDFGWQEVYNMLNLECKRRNMRYDNTKAVVDFIFSVITTKIDPATEQEQNDLIAKVLDYAKHKDELEKKENEVAARERAADSHEVMQANFKGMNFSKKE